KRPSPPSPVSPLASGSGRESNTSPIYVENRPKPGVDDNIDSDEVFKVSGDVGGRKTPDSRPYLSGDWGGLRPYLERKGLTFTLSYTNDFLANVRGGIGPGAVGIGVFQPQLDVDLQKLVGWEGGKIHTHGLITHGPFFSATYLGNILAVSNLEAGPVARLY